MKGELVSMRDVYGDELVRLGAVYPDLVVLDSDVSTSTKTIIFSQEYPERFLNVGVAEANMVDIAAGLALSGFRVIVNSFAVFLTLKAMEQIRYVVAYNIRQKLWHTLSIIKKRLCYILIPIIIKKNNMACLKNIISPHLKF